MLHRVPVKPNPKISRSIGLSEASADPAVLFSSPSKSKGLELGLLSDPFHHISATSFNRFLGNLIKDRDANSESAQRIIIDTNYHPCHLFQIKHLAALGSGRDPVQLRLWFLWSPRVLRQLLHYSVNHNFIFADEVLRFTRTLSAFDSRFVMRDDQQGFRSPVFHLLPAAAFASPQHLSSRYGSAVQRLLEVVYPASHSPVGCVESLLRLNNVFFEAYGDMAAETGNLANSSQLTTMIGHVAKQLSLTEDHVVRDEIDYNRVIDGIAQRFTENRSYCNLLAMPWYDKRLFNYQLEAYRHPDPLEFLALHEEVCETAFEMMKIVDRIT